MAADALLLLTALLVTGFLFLALGYLLGRRLGAEAVHRRWERELPRIRKAAVARSRAALAGRLSEHVAPYLPDFPFRPTEARFLGTPVDFVVFPGLDRRTPAEVVFVEVKSGRSSLSTVQRRLREAVESGRVRWMVYRVPAVPRATGRLDGYLP